MNSATTQSTDIETVTIANGPARAELMSYGASMTGFHLDGIAHSLVLGSSHPASYCGPLRYFGAIVGPVANRIAGGRAPLGDGTLRLSVNENGNALHGGRHGLSDAHWRIEDLAGDRVVFCHIVPDGHGGLPGPIEFRVRYALDAKGTLELGITATSAALTLCNPAFHGYWALSENGLSDHRLTIDADHYLPVDDALIPTGDIAKVQGTAYDLRSPRALPAAIDLDINFCLNGKGMRPVLRLETDRLAMIVETDAPGLQVYDAARLDTSPATGHHGLPYGRHAGIALEPQLWPDGPNHAGFPSIALRPGDMFCQTSRFQFIRKQTP